MDKDLEALFKLTEVVDEMNRELAELKKNYENHGHIELIKENTDYKPRER